MILYSGVAVVTILLGLLVDNRRKRQNGIVTRQQILNVLSLVSVFLILFALSACRLNVGNDYAKNAADGSLLFACLSLGQGSEKFR